MDNQFAHKQRYAEPLSPLSRIMEEAPYLPRCSRDKTATLVRPVEYAIRYPYMQINRAGMVSWLIFDLDHNNPLAWEEVGLPCPNIVVTNRKNGHSHVYYAINPVCTTESARSKPIQYMKAIYSAMSSRMNADPSYSGPVAKTPGHPWWKTWELHNNIYELGELADYVDLPELSPWSKGPDLDSVSHSRHCMLFEETRFYAYSIVSREREQGSYKSFHRAVEAYAHNRNNYNLRGFSSNLSLSQVRATVKSIARWTWDKYRGTSSCNKGVMRLSQKIDLSLKDKQRLSARRTHKNRTQSTESKIRAALHQCKASGTKPTQKVLAKISGLTRQTIARYKHIKDEFTNSAPNNIVSSGSIIKQGENVKNAVHQITAPLRQIKKTNASSGINEDLCKGIDSKAPP